jgi:phosphotransferase system enzyme I (PtsI)
MMNGIGVSPGIAIGKAFVFGKAEIAVEGRLLAAEDLAWEIERFDAAVCLALYEIGDIKSNPHLTLSADELAILEVQVELTNDPQIKEDVVEKINTENKTAADALTEVIASLVEAFEAMGDEYLSARSADLKDAAARILSLLRGIAPTVIPQFDSDTVIIADDISPSETMTMNLKHLRGFATRAGSKTSHTAIIAKAKGLPAVVGCKDGLSAVKDGDVIILDGTTGLVFINPDKETITAYQAKRDLFNQDAEKLKGLKNLPSQTTDGTAVHLEVNISGVDDMLLGFENGGEGVGLLRTELLFMNRDSFPTEDEQFEFYKNIAINSKNKPVIVRTIDIGGDKQLPYFNIPAELNPFLGYRAIRICLDRTDIFITQLKAVLRASVFGDLRIMFPMIANVQEIRAAKQILAQAKTELATGNIPFTAGIKVGIMIEIPSAAVMADILAREVDFFSIGTNDLCQYTLAVDRMNEKISHLYDTYNPGVLRLISNVIEQGNKHNIHVGMCGEMAGDPLATLLLLGMGLKEFSMGPAAIPEIKNIIINNSEAKAKQVFAAVMQMDSSTEILTYLKQVV